MTTRVKQRSLKHVLKVAMVETLQEQRELFHEVFAEVLEEFALAEAIGEGKRTARVSRSEVFRVVDGRS